MFFFSLPVMVNKVVYIKIAKNSPSAHHHTTLSGCVFATKAWIDNRKNVLNSNISSIYPHNMPNVGPLTAEIGSRLFGAPQQISTGFASCLRYCRDVAHRRREVNQTLHDVWPSPGLVHYIYILGALAPKGILLQSSLCVQVLRSPILTALLHGTPAAASAKLCGAKQRAPPIFGKAAITLGIGPHSRFVFFTLPRVL